MNQFAVDGLLYGGSDGNKSTADRVLLQFAANVAARGLIGSAWIRDLGKHPCDGHNYIADDREENQENEKTK